MSPTEEVIRPEEQYYILAPAAGPSEQGLVLKNGDMFGVFDSFGDIGMTGRGQEGLYYHDTRFLSAFRLLLVGSRPLMLSATVRRDNVLLAADLTNPDVYSGGAVVLPRGSIHVYRTRFLWDQSCHERVRIRNFATVAHRLRVRIEFAADFVDVFEVRGQSRERRGHLIDPVLTADSIAFGYLGLDGVLRRSVLELHPPPLSLNATAAEYWLDLPAKQETEIVIQVRCEEGAVKEKVALRYQEALAQAEARTQGLHAQEAIVRTPDNSFNSWIQRSHADFHMMVSDTETGLYPYAGVPWFCTPFGRDGIITALESLWNAPAIAKGVLAYLAASQATAVIPEKDAEPGKILHETRFGEMARLNEVPFERYYGSVDSTPLFVELAGAYYQRTGDRALLESIWPAIERALDWINQFGDQDGDGFVEYSRRTPTGLVQQGWKDSHDSVFHSTGELAEGPIALCEVQAYVYGAKVQAAMLADVLGRDDLAATLRKQAQRLQTQFQESFWCEEIRMFALALDGQKRQCKVRSSNAGQCLRSGIATREQAQAIEAQLMSEEFFNGWGMRTIGRSELRYNPMSYHNGSVWPHDNALIAAGFARYGMKGSAARILRGMFEASTFLDLNRLPELFCGFERRPGKGPTLYPVACNPQTWAAGATFSLIHSCTGLCIDWQKAQVAFQRPVLPEGLESLRIRDLRVGDGCVDVQLFRAEESVALNLEKRTGNLEVILIS